MAARLQPRKGVASEASAKAALEAYVKTWNRHNVNAWAAKLTEDIWYTEAIDVLRHHARILPKKGGKFASAFESTPTLARWRIEDGAWKMFFFTSHKGTALSEMKKDGVS